MAVIDPHRRLSDNNLNPLVKYFESESAMLAAQRRILDYLVSLDILMLAFQ